MRIKFENVWVVDELNLMPYKSNQNFHEQFEHLKDIHFDTSGTDVSELHLPHEITKENKNEPVGIKSALGWVLLGGNNNKKYSLNSNRIYVCESNVHDSLKQFWQIESYGTSKEDLETLLQNQIKRLLKY